MTRVSLIRLGSAAPMGQQTYESELLVALRQHLGDDWIFDERAVLPMRAARGVGRRLPLRLVWSVPYALAGAAGALAYGRADVIHRLDLRCPPSGHRHEVLTVHDLPPLRFDDEGTIPHWAARSARAAAAVICPSEFAAAEVKELLGVRRVEVVPYGIDRARAEARPLSEAELVELGLRRPVVVHAAGATDRKNLKLLAAAWQDVVKAHREPLLALCGPPDARRDEAFRGISNVVYLGQRQPSFVARLMRSAAVVVVPSTYEGFGLPALEGMAAGAVVVAAMCGALPEVCADAALLVPPERQAFAAAIERALAGGSEINRLRSAGRARAASFSWERAAHDTVAIYQRVLG